MGEGKHNAPILAGVVGWPVAHSLSPLIHGTWAKRAGVKGYYIPIPVAPDYNDFAVAMDALKTLGFAGVNVTIPHKEHALRYASTASDAARKAGAANMLTFGAQTFADNSDIIGFAEAVRATSSVPRASALVLGAGGAARGVVLALQRLGLTDIVVANRTRAKSEELAKAFGLSVADWEDRSKVLENIDFLVNTTSLGMTGQPPLEIDLTGLKSAALVADIVYAPLETHLLKTAKTRGHETVDGLAMLMHQAVPGFKTWFGGEAVIDDALRAVLVEELNKRSGA